MNRLIAWSVGIIAAVAFCWLFPLFRIVPLEQTQAARQRGHFNASEFAGDFWTRRLLPALDRATDASLVLGALAEDAKAAAERFGRRVGIGGGHFFFLRGTGVIVSVDRKGVGVSLSGSESNADVLLATGLLFGNALRDGTGLLDPSDFPDSQDFNALSTELNGIVERQVIPRLKEEAAVGRRVEFVGCAEVADEGGQVRLLTVVPVFVNVE